MRNWRSFAPVLWVLAAMATVGGPLLRNGQARGADALEDQGPRALLLITNHSSRALASGSYDHNNYERYVQTQLVLIKSRVVVDSVVRQAAISRLTLIKSQTDPSGWLERNLEAVRLKNSEVIQVSMAAQSGADAKDQSAIINAVVQAYMDKVANGDREGRAHRHAMLKNLSRKYQEMIRERRDTVSKLSESAANGNQFASPEHNNLSRRYDKLMDQRLAIRLDRARSETLLGRKSKGPASQTEPVRAEIALLEDHLAVLTAQERALHDELEQLTREARTAAHIRLELADLTADIAQMEDTYRKINAEVEAINIELEGPPYVRVFQDAGAAPQ